MMEEGKQWDNMMKEVQLKAESEDVAHPLQNKQNRQNLSP